MKRIESLTCGLLVGVFLFFSMSDALAQNRGRSGAPTSGKRGGDFYAPRPTKTPDQIRRQNTTNEARERAKHSDRINRANRQPPPVRGNSASRGGGGGVGSFPANTPGRRDPTGPRILY